MNNYRYRRKKLSLSKETLRHLGAEEQLPPAGAAELARMTAEPTAPWSMHRDDQIFAPYPSPAGGHCRYRRSSTAVKT